MSYTALRVMEKGAKASFETLNDEPLSTGQLRIKVEYSCLNYKDALAVTASSPIMRELPCTAGIDLAGKVIESQDTRFAAGDKVLVCGANLGEVYDGGLAEQAQVAAESAVKLPTDFSPREAMIYGTAGFTAALAMLKLVRNQQRPEDGPIAVTGATGGVGSFAIALLARAGFEAAAITRKRGETDYLQKLGASQIVDANHCGQPKGALMKPLWAGAVDNLGGDMLAWLIASTKPHGNVASIGLASSFKLNTTVMPFILRGVNLLGIHSVDIPSELRQNTWAQIFTDWRLPEPDQFLADTISLHDVPEACNEIIAGAVRGRYLVKIDA